jgi:hypothetical protein
MASTRRTLNVSLGEDSPTRFDTGDYELRQTTTNLDFSRELRLGERSFVLAVGGEYRYENYLTYAGDQASYIGSGADGANGLSPSEESDLDRNVFGTYAELSGDLTDRFLRRCRHPLGALRRRRQQAHRQAQWSLQIDRAMGACAVLYRTTSVRRHWHKVASRTPPATSVMAVR